MIKRLFNVSVTKGYLVALSCSAIPLFAFSVVVLIMTSNDGSQIDAFQQQIASSGAADVQTVAEGAKSSLPSGSAIFYIWAIVQLVGVALGGLLLKKSLGRATELATEQLVSDARTVASGDLRPRPTAWFTNEYGRMQESMGRMVASFRDTIQRIEFAAEELKQASGEMAHTSDDAGRAIGEVAQAVSAISEGASHQVDLVTQSAQVVNGIEARVRDTTEYASEAQRQSADTEQLAEQGLEHAAEVQQAMEAVRERSLNTAEVVRSLGDKSSDIDQIVQAITAIAEQTNMLALNASIEAARAGDQGRGFANVAEEVRVLAEDAQKSAEQIATLVREIKLETEQAVQAMEESVTRVERGFETVNSNRQTFFDISGAVRALRESSDDISNLANGIAAGTGRVRGQIEQVASVAEQSSAATEEVSASTQETAAAAEEVSASAQKVAHTAALLAELAGRFVLPDADERAA